MQQRVGNTFVFLVAGWNVDDLTIGPTACMQ